MVAQLGQLLLLLLEVVGVLTLTFIIITILGFLVMLIKECLFK